MTVTLYLESLNLSLLLATDTEEKKNHAGQRSYVSIVRRRNKLCLAS
jgi:hypothetical protein